MIYADNAATTSLAPEALAAMMTYLQEEYGNASQPYLFSRASKKALKKARETIAGCINAEPEEIFFTSGGTESDNWAIKGTMFVYGDNRALITSQIEHHAILHSAASVERMGYPVTYLPVDDKGTISPKTLEAHITDRTKLVSIMFSNNEVGTIEPIKELATITHAHGAIFHTDAVQAIGHVNVDVKALGIDMLSASAHKFNGPKGIGFLYIKKGVRINPFNDGGSQESGMRAGTENIASIVGMAKALEKNCLEIPKFTSKMEDLEKSLLMRLDSAGIDYRRNGFNHVPGNVSLSFKNAEGEMLLHRLDLKGICVSTGAACDSKNTQVSHVIEAIHIPEEYAYGTIRISFGKNNTVEEAISIANAIISIIKK